VWSWRHHPDKGQTNFLWPLIILFPVIDSGLLLEYDAAARLKETAAIMERALHEEKFGHDTSG